MSYKQNLATDEGVQELLIKLQEGEKKLKKIKFYFNYNKVRDIEKMKKLAY
jgi:hypothetical protein